MSMRSLDEARRLYEHLKQLDLDCGDLQSIYTGAVYSSARYALLEAQADTALPPLRVVAGKVGGTHAGFIVDDAEKVVHTLKGIAEWLDAVALAALALMHEKNCIENIAMLVRR